MRNSLSPLGILIAHTLPAALLLFLYGSMLAVIRPLLSAESLHLWTLYGSALVGMTLIATVYAIVLQRRRAPVHFIYGLLIFLLYVPLLWGFMEQYRELVPWEVPRWMMPQDGEFYAIRLLSIPLAHALFILVATSLPAGDRGKPLRDLLIAVGIPLVCYLFVQVVEPWRMGIDFERHVWLVLMVVLVVLFLFFLSRGIGAIIGRSSPSDAWAFALRILVALLLPLTGLLVNNGVFEHEASGAFGDLGHWGFYTVAALNGLVVAWGSSTDPRIRFVQFLLRAIGFSYVLFFFVLFLPFLPLSIIAIIAIGIGFLMLAPILLFVVQGMQLLGDIRFLRAHRSGTSIAALFGVALLVLPGIITVRYMHHRNVLHAALAYVYHADPRATDPDPIDADALGTVLNHVQGNKGRRGWGNSHTPFLTPWYNYVVLDNLTVSDDKLGHLRRIFLDEEQEPARRRRWMPPNNMVTLDTVSTRPTYDPAQKAWRTWVDLTMTNTDAQQAEFVTTFALPDGAWISDEYLMIEGREVKGILAEKKAATWVYQQIVNVRRDPSITRYTGPGRIQLRVFPFAQNETRTAGFEVLHKEPITITLDHRPVLLGDSTQGGVREAITSSDGNTVYIPGAVKHGLPMVVRKPRIHLLVDGTETNRAMRDAVVQRINNLVQGQQVEPADIDLHIVDAYTTSAPWTDDGAGRLLHHVGEGGYFTDRAIRKVLIEACSHPSPSRPVIVLVPSLPVDTNAVPGIWLDELEDLAACIPEGSTFFVAGEHTLSLRAFTDPDEVLETIALSEPRIGRPVPVRAWPDAKEPKAYLAMDSTASVVPITNGPVANAALKLRDWNDALALEGRWRNHLLHPEGGTSAWRGLVRGSFQAQVLTPVTAWMCLEDDAQRNALLKKQEEVLNADAALDASDESINTMSEPEIWWLLVPLLFIAVWKWRR